MITSFPSSFSCHSNSDFTITEYYHVHNLALVMLSDPQIIWPVTGNYLFLINHDWWQRDFESLSVLILLACYSLMGQCNSYSCMTGFVFFVF